MFEEAIKLIGTLIEGCGVGTIVIGIAAMTFVFLKQLHNGAEDAYKYYRRGVGRSILLGLEFLVAGDIIRTVAIDPTFNSLGILAGIVLIRTFLSWSLEVELEGRWPWQRRTGQKRENSQP